MKIPLSQQQQFGGDTFSPAEIKSVAQAIGAEHSRPTQQTLSCMRESTPFTFDIANKTALAYVPVIAALC